VLRQGLQAVDGAQVEVKSGIKTGELVIVKGQAGLPDGARITPAAAPQDK